MKVESKRPHVVILGGGFGGLSAARQLRKAAVEVTLVDKHNYHLFQPLLYQVATGDLSPANIASPLRVLTRHQQNCRVVLGDVRSINVAERRVVLVGEELTYDYLVVATGASHSYFGNDHWEERAPGLKTIEDATRIRRNILFALEAAEREKDPKRRAAWLTFVIVGGGPTGVEMAGAIGEISRNSLKSDFRSIRNEQAKILLVEGQPHVLPMYPDELCETAERALAKNGVDVVTDALVSNVEEEQVEIVRKQPDGSQEQTIVKTRTVVWAAGVRASDLGRQLAEQTGTELDRVGRLIVRPNLTLDGHAEIFAIGDLACYKHQGDHPLPGLAPVAMQQGQNVAKRIKARLSGKEELPPFQYRDRGSMAVIGRYSAVGMVGSRQLRGIIAWFIWLFVHLMELTQFRNRILVLFQWGWSFLTRDRSARLITGQDHDVFESCDPRGDNLASPVEPPETSNQDQHVARS